MHFYYPIYLLLQSLSYEVYIQSMQTKHRNVNCYAQNITACKDSLTDVLVWSLLRTLFQNTG